MREFINCPAPRLDKVAAEVDEDLRRQKSFLAHRRSCYHDVERFLSDASFPYAIGYGLTETSPLIAGCSPSVVKFRSTGTVLPQLDVRIADPDPKTKVGEIQIKGPTVMKGYYKDKQRTEQAFTEDGYFKTGDLGLLTKKNYLYINGRIKNVIIGPGGENIYAEEIEAKLNEAESVLESMFMKAKVTSSPECF